MKRIYMDYAATSPVKAEVLKAMLPYFSEKFGNPSSVHLFGRETRNVLDQSRDIVARFLNCLPEEVIFNSGGTEGDNMGIKGIVEHVKNVEIVENVKNVNNISTNNMIQQFQQGEADSTSLSSAAIQRLPHIITSAFEHHAILDTCKDLEKRDLAEVTYLKPKSDGVIDIKDVEKTIKPNTILITIMYVNNEIGTVQPIREIGKLVERVNKQRIAYGISHIVNKENDRQFAISNKLYFHTDAVQAIEYFNCDTKYLHVDALSLSAHKFGGPKGIGVFFVKKGTPLHKQNIGGAQEHNKRAGTENVPGIVGLGKAIELIANRISHIVNKKNDKLYAISDTQKLRDYFINQVTKKIDKVTLNGSKEFRSPNNINLAFKHVEGESILLNLDLVGVAASSGSACTSGSLEPSHVLTAMGLPAEVAHGSIRFTIGEKTTKDEIDYVVKNLVEIIKKLRAISPFK